MHESYELERLRIQHVERAKTQAAAAVAAEKEAKRLERQERLIQVQARRKAEAHQNSLRTRMAPYVRKARAGVRHARRGVARGAAALRARAEERLARGARAALGARKADDDDGASAGEFDDDDDELASPSVRDWTMATSPSGGAAHRAEVRAALNSPPLKSRAENVAPIGFGASPKGAATPKSPAASPMFPPIGKPRSPLATLGGTLARNVLTPKAGAQASFDDF